MKNYVHDGDILTVTLSEESRSGRPVILGDLFGIAVTDGRVGQQVAVTLQGVFVLPKLPGAIAQGERVFWQKAQVAPPKDEGVTKTPEGNKLIGVAASAADPADSGLEVRLNGTF